MKKLDGVMSKPASLFLILWFTILKYVLIQQF